MADLNTLRKELAENEQWLTSLQGKLKRSDALFEQLKRSGDEEGLSAAQAESERLRAEIQQEKESIVSFKSGPLAEELQAVVDATGENPGDAINAVDSHMPILLFPVRLQTKFRLDLNELWVRIYPDDIAVETHEPLLTEQEYEAGSQYYRELWNAAKEEDAAIREEHKKAAWRSLATEVGPQRAAWIERMFEGWFLPEEDETLPFNTPYVLNFPSDGESLEPSFRPVEEVPLRPDSWSEAPKCHVMPDRFMVRLYRRDDVVKEAWGNPIPHPLTAGPHPYPYEESADSLLDEDSAWMADFDKAVEIGMGLRIDLSGLPAGFDVNQGFTRVIVLGIKASTDTDMGAAYLKNLFEGHQYTEGVSFVPQGTPTNNTAEEKSGYASRDEGFEESYRLVHGQPLVMGEEDYPGTNGYRLARALGIELERRYEAPHPFDFVSHAGDMEHSRAEMMHEALWPATWGYFLREMMVSCFSKTATEIDALIDQARSHFIEYVRARGPLPAIRVGNMPYGILPTSAYSRWLFADGEEGDDFIIRKLQEILTILYEKWKSMTADAESVPRTGGSSDPEKELLRILGMEPTSRACRIRPVASDSYLWNLLYYLVRELEGGSLPGKLDDRLRMTVSRSWADMPRTVAETPEVMSQVTGRSTERTKRPLEQWWEKFLNAKQPCMSLVQELGCTKTPPALSLVPWGSGYDLPVPLVTETTISDILQSGDQPSGSLLYYLLKQAVARDGQRVKDSLGNLQTLTVPDLEQLLCETLDLSTYRLDAWMTSLVTRRLFQSIRVEDSATQRGICLGCFGWLEDLKPAGTQKTSGYIHAPSISQAATAAVLRSAYLSHSDKDNAEVMAVDLSSQRVRRSLWLLDGIREGQSLSALLGYQFERNLHENYHQPGGVELDQYIQPIRKLYPLTAGKETPLQSGESAEAIAARNVVDGLKLLEAWEKKTIPFGQEGLPSVNTAPYTAIARELDSLDETLDALGDLGLAESVFQSVRGNYDRAGALLDAVAGNGRPPEPEVVCTPRGGISLKHRALMLFTGNPDAINPWPATPRGTAEPHLNAWAAKMLGDPERVKCRAWYGTGTVEEEMTVSLKDLSIGPLDVLFLSMSPTAGEATELEQRIAYFVRTDKSLSVDTSIRIEFQRGGYCGPDDVTFPEILELARRMQDVIFNARPLTPAELHLPEEADADPRPDFSDSTYDVLMQRITANDRSGARDVVEDARTVLENAYETDNINTLRTTLLALSRFGITGTVPESAQEAAKNIVLSQAQYAAIIKEVQTRLDQCDYAVQSAGQTPSKAAGVPLLIQALKALFGSYFTVIPPFAPPNQAELAATFAPAHRDQLLGNGTVDGWEVDRWLQQAASTHPSMRRFETMLMLGSALSQADMPVRIGQLPFRETDRWMALPFAGDAEEEKPQGTLSLVVYPAGTFDPSREFAGIVLDDWDELIPNTEETTAIAYQFDQPNSEPPQSLLLAVSPVIQAEGSWQWDDLVATVLETLDMAKVRAVDLDALKGVGCLLPALYLPVGFMGDPQPDPVG